MQLIKIETIVPVPVKAHPDPQNAARQAILHPTGGKELSQLARKSNRVALIVDDHTRNTPALDLIHPILETLLAAGLTAAQIKIVIALGSHRPMSTGELETKLGWNIINSYQIVNQPAEPGDGFAYLGDSNEGIPAWVNRTVAEADLRIGIGSVTPHMDAGYSGGAKIILPGVCAMSSVDAFHVRLAWHPGNSLGRLDAPLRRDLESFVMARCPLHFIVNAVCNLQGELVDCVAGDAIHAHRQAVNIARSVYGVQILNPYPIVIAHAYPYQQDLWQMMKGLWCGELLTADGGLLVLEASLPEGSLRYPLLPEYLSRPPQDLFADIQYGRVADPKSAATAVVVGYMKQRIRIGIVSDGISEQDVHQMGFYYFPSLDEAIQGEISRIPRNKHVAARVPYAGVTLPLIAP